MTGAALRLVDFSFAYPGTEAAALHGVSLDVAPGEIVGVVGAEGSGRTSLGMAVCGFVPRFTGGETTGAVEVDGRDLRQAPVGDLAGQTAMVFEDPDSQLSQVHVLDEVLAPLVNRGVARHEAEWRAERLLERVGLEPLLGRRRAWRLSVGDKMRLALAAALATRPRLLVLDAVAGRLDPAGRSRLAALVRAMAPGITVVVVDDDLELMASVAERVVVLVEGAVAAVGPTAEVLGDADLAARAGIDLPVSRRLASDLGLGDRPVTVDRFRLSLATARFLQEPGTPASPPPPDPPGARKASGTPGMPAQSSGTSGVRERPAAPGTPEGRDTFGGPRGRGRFGGPDPRPLWLPPDASLAGWPEALAPPAAAPGAPVPPAHAVEADPPLPRRQRGRSLGARRSDAVNQGAGWSEGSLDDLQRMVGWLRSETGREPDPVLPSPSPSLARLVDVVYAYGDGTRALAGVSLDLHAGRVHGLVGGNGSGKSTLLRMLAGLVHPDRGRVEVLGRELADRKARDLVGTVGIVLPDPDHQITERTVAAEVGFALRRRRRGGGGGRGRGPLARRRQRRQQIAARVQAVCERVGLGDVLDDDPRLLRRAQRRLVTLASALVLDPPIVVLDEPSVGLDATRRARLLDLVRDLRDEGRAVLLAENDIDLVAEASDDVTLLQRGRVSLQGRLDEVFAEPNWDTLVQARTRPPRAAELGQVLGVRAVNYRQLVPARAGAPGGPTTTADA